MTISSILESLFKNCFSCYTFSKDSQGESGFVRRESSVAPSCLPRHQIVSPILMACVTCERISEIVIRAVEPTYRMPSTR